MIKVLGRWRCLPPRCWGVPALPTRSGRGSFTIPLSTDSEGDIAGWGAGGTIGVVANDGLQAVQLCCRGSWSFGKATIKDGTNRDVVNSTPIEVCAEFPGGLLMKALGILAVAVLVTACEEMVEGPPPRPVEPVKPAQLYTEIGAAELLERWTVLPNGAVAAAVNTGGRRLAAATDGFSGLPTFRFSDAREYGACVVFTAKYEIPASDPGEPGPPSDPGPAEPTDPPSSARAAAQGARTAAAHVIDCPGTPVEGNKVGGPFHAAHLCFPGEDLVHILRAGDFNPTTHVHDLGVPGVKARIGDHSGSFQWLKHITSEAYEGSVLVESSSILVNWAFTWDGAWAGFDRLHRHQEDLHFSIDDSAAVVDVEPNDGAAFTEYRRRCESLVARQ